MAEKFRDEDEEPIHHIDDDQSKEKQESEAIRFGSQPVSMKCPFCLQNTRTQIIAKPELVSIVLGLVLFSISPNAIMIIVVVVALQITATKKHRCALCERQLGTDGKFLIVFTDEVYSFSFGETGILISKKIVVTTCLFISIFFIISIKGNMAPNLNWSDISWQGYKTQCPITMANPKCIQKYQGMTVKNWKGYVMRVQDERRSIKRFYDNAVKLFIKMDPSQQKQDYPDLVLAGASSAIFEYEQILDNLRHGDQIVFNATFRNVSRQNEIFLGRHLHLYDLNKTGLHNDNIEIYVKAEEEELMSNKIEGQKLRTEKSEQQILEDNQRQRQKQEKIIVEQKENPTQQPSSPNEQQKSQKTQSKMDQTSKRGKVQNQVN